MFAVIKLSKNIINTKNFECHWVHWENVYRKGWKNNPFQEKFFFCCIFICNFLSIGKSQFTIIYMCCIVYDSSIYGKYIKKTNQYHIRRISTVNDWTQMVIHVKMSKLREFNGAEDTFYGKIHFRFDCLWWMCL